MNELQVTIRGFDGRPMVVTKAMLETLPFLRLQELREVNQDDQLTQDFLANYEHRAFTREFVRNPDTSNLPTRALALGLATPAYAGLKATGLLPKSVQGTGRASTPSLEQVKQGMIGIGEGIKGYGEDRLNQFKGLMSGY
jgi:hypothetical protein